jgi:hypothetical protein
MASAEDKAGKDSPQPSDVAPVASFTVDANSGLAAEELLDLAQEAGRLGIFEWLVPSGAVRLSAKFRSLYGLIDFDGRYATWLESIFREDRIRVTHVIETAFEASERELRMEFRIKRKSDDATRWIEARNVAFYGPTTSRFAWLA